MSLTSVRTTRGALVACLASLLASAPAAAAITASTSFENEATNPAWNYIDTGNSAIDHDLENHPNETLVDSTAAGSGAVGDLGYDARYETTGGDGIDGPLLGVVVPSSANEAATDGTNVYRMQNTDGRMVLEFDPVAIVTPTTFEIDYFVNDSAWEWDPVGDPLRTDFFEIFLTIDGTSKVSLIDTTGTDIDDLGIEETWATLSADLTGLGTSAILTVAFKGTEGSEYIQIDRVQFEAVPEPSSALIGGIGALVAAFVKRRR